MNRSHRRAEMFDHARLRWLLVPLNEKRKRVALAVTEDAEPSLGYGSPNDEEGDGLEDTVSVGGGVEGKEVSLGWANEGTQLRMAGADSEDEPDHDGEPSLCGTTGSRIHGLARSTASRTATKEITASAAAMLTIADTLKPPSNG